MSVIFIAVIIWVTVMSQVMLMTVDLIACNRISRTLTLENVY